jgi:photosystem II stability/assembly factor-like uncharacterized protein
MKKISIIILLSTSFLAFNSHVYSQPGWVLQSPVPSGFYNFFNVQFLNRNTGYVIGGIGIFKTTNSGANWNVTNLQDTINLRWMSFVNDLTGYVSGYSNTNHSCIYKTTNGGNNWGIKYFSQNANIGLLSFCNANTGYYSYGNTAGVMKTSDGGDNWFTQSLPSVPLIHALYFINSITGFAGTGNNSNGSIVLRTTNGGMNWLETDLNHGAGITSISFVDSLNGYMSADGLPNDRWLFKTTDGGNSWINIPLPIQYVLITSIKFADVNIGYLLSGRSDLGDANIISKTTDGAQTWVAIYPAIPPNLESICTVDSQYVFAAGYYEKILKSTDSGNSWNYQCSTGPHAINQICFANQLTGIAVGSGISRTTNGGLLWYPIALPPTLIDATVRSALFINGSTGFASTNQELLLRTSDYGATWNVNSSPAGYDLYSLYFTNDQTGYLVTNSGLAFTNLLRTTNQGADWNLLSICSDSGHVNAICFTDLNTGYIAGNYIDINLNIVTNEVFKSSDGGITWRRMYLNMGHISDFSSISFPSSNYGYICGGNRILRTTNAGVNWTTKTFGNISELNAISFINNQTGYCVGGYQVNNVLKTTDGGDNWMAQDCTSSSFGQYGLQSIFISNDSIAWVAGNGAAIYKTTTGGNPIAIKRISQNVPQNYTLSQNYPNPFNPSTVIMFQISSYKFVNLVIYDILGRKVATLINENLKPGEYETEWNASNFASGVYFYKLTINTEQSTIYSQTKKLVLLK